MKAHHWYLAKWTMMETCFRADAGDSLIKREPQGCCQGIWKFRTLLLRRGNRPLLMAECSGHVGLNIFLGLRGRKEEMSYGDGHRD